MFFLSFLSFAFFTLESSRPIVELNMSNPYGNISYPSRFNGIRICFNRPNVLTNGYKRITIDDQKIFEEKNLLSTTIYEYLQNNSIPKNSIVYLDIPSITDIDSHSCSFMANIKAIDAR
jgi:hypothetical protein